MTFEKTLAIGFKAFLVNWLISSVIIGITDVLTIEKMMGTSIEAAAAAFCFAIFIWLTERSQNAR